VETFMMQKVGKKILLNGLTDRGWINIVAN